MVFNSLSFFIFFIVVYILYLILPHRAQNRMLLGASYVCYGAWNWKFLLFLFLSSFLDYYCALKISETRNRKNYFYV
jgi:hypothetical protein